MLRVQSKRYAFARYMLKMITTILLQVYIHCSISLQMGFYQAMVLTAKKGTAKSWGISLDVKEETQVYKKFSNIVRGEQKMGKTT